MRARRTVAVLLAALAAAACVRSPGDEPGGLRAVPLGGDVRLVRGDEPAVLDEVAALEPGDLVRTGADGRARLELGVGRSVELAPRAEVVVGGLGLAEVVEGSVLARADDPGVALLAGDAEIEGRGSVFRVDRGFSVTLAVYRGEAAVTGAGVPSVPALRQLTVVAGGSVPRGPRPLVVDPDDPWDVRLLGPFIDLGLRLVGLQQGLGRQVPSERAVVELLGREVPPPLARALSSRPVAPTEAILAAVVALEAAADDEASLLSVLDQVLDLRLQGAHWIVVLAQWGLVGTALIEELGRLSALLAEVVAPSAAPAAAGGAGGSRSGGGARSGGGGSGGSGGSGSGGSGGSGDTGGDAGGTDGSGGSGGSTDGSGGQPLDACSDPVGCVVEDVVEVIEDPPVLP